MGKATCSSRGGAVSEASRGQCSDLLISQLASEAQRWYRMPKAPCQLVTVPRVPVCCISWHHTSLLRSLFSSSMSPTLLATSPPVPAQWLPRRGL